MLYSSSYQARQNPLASTTKLVAMYAGPQATGFADTTNTFKTKWDTIPRFEIDDSKAKLTSPVVVLKQKLLKNEPVTLGEVLQHDELFKQYPDLKNIRVGKNYTQRKSGVPEGSEVAADYNRVLDEINFNPARMLSDAAVKANLLHEIQHAIQKRENMGTKTLPTQNVQTSPREIEAYDTKERMEMTGAERSKVAPYTSQKDKMFQFVPKTLGENQYAKHLIS